MDYLTEYVDFEPNPSIPRPASVGRAVPVVRVTNPASLPVPAVPVRGTSARDVRGRVVVPGDPRYALAPARGAATAAGLVERARQSGFTLETRVAEWLASNPTQVEDYFRSVLSGGRAPNVGYPYEPDYRQADGGRQRGSDDEFVLTGSKDGGLRGAGAINTSTMLLLGGGALGLFLLLNKK